MQSVGQLIVVLIAVLAAVIAHGAFGWLGAVIAFPVSLAVVSWLSHYEEICE